MKRLATALTLGLGLTLCLAPAVPAAAPDEFHGSFADTVIQIEFEAVGDRVDALYLSDGAESRMYLAVTEAFTAGQRLGFSVFARGDYRVRLWGGGEPLELLESEPVDLPAGKGLRLVYADGTIVVIVA